MIFFKNTNKQTIFAYILIYLFLLFKVGFFFNENGSAISSILLLILCLVYNTTYNKGRISSKAASIVMVVLLLQFITYLFTGFPNFAQYGLSLINYLTIVVLVSSFDFQEYAICYSNILLVICLASILCYILISLGIPFYHYFPILTNSAGTSAHFLVLTDIWTLGSSSNGFNRAMGIFWEPGAFQAMITFAGIVDLYRDIPRKFLNYRMIIYCLTIIITFSSTGYISLILLILLFVKTKTRHSMIYLTIVCLAGFFLLAYLYTTSSGFLFHTMFGKFEAVETVLSGGEATASESTRVESVIYPLKKFIESPIIGYGTAGEEQMTRELQHSMFTCTIINYFAKFGLLYGLIHMVGFYKLLKLNKKGILEALFLSLLVVVTTISEAFDYNPVLEICMLYGYMKTKYFHF